MSTLPAGITPPGTGRANPSEDVSWNILGHVYWLKAQSEDCFAFETLDPPGTLVPPPGVCTWSARSAVNALTTSSGASPGRPLATLCAEASSRRSAARMPEAAIALTLLIAPF